MALETIQVAFAIRLINTILLVYLMGFYWKSYSKIKSGFTTGLLFFSIFLFLQNLSAIFFRLLSGFDVDEELSVQNTVLNMLQMAGLISLVYVTRK